MITVFNRKELFIAISMQEQAQIRDLLGTHNVRYSLKVRAFGGNGGDVDGIYKYIFYVHKNDYEAALAVVSGRYVK